MLHRATFARSRRWLLTSTVRVAAGAAAATRPTASMSHRGGCIPGQAGGAYGRPAGRDLTWPWLLLVHLVYLQVGDAVAATGEVVPAGQGDGQVRETWLRCRAGYAPFTSLVLHQARASRYGG